MRCPNCNADLRGKVTNDICDECGAPVALTEEQPLTQALPGKKIHKPLPR